MRVRRIRTWPWYTILVESHIMRSVINASTDQIARRCSTRVESESNRFDAGPADIYAPGVGSIRSDRAVHTNGGPTRQEGRQTQQPPDRVPLSGDQRRPYTPARLVVYGGVARITAKVGSRGMKDMSGNRRTGF